MLLFSRHGKPQPSVRALVASRKRRLLTEENTVKPEITHNLGGHQILWVITGYGFSQVYLHMFHKSWWTQKAMDYHRLWVITVWVISGLTVHHSRRTSTSSS